MSDEVVVHESFTISQVSEFLSALSRDNERRKNPYPKKLKTQQTGWIFRGHADSRWELIPLALRTGTILEFMTPVKHAPLSNNREQIGAEYRLIEKFRQFLDERGLPIPEDSQEFHSNKIKTIKELILPILKGKKLGLLTNTFRLWPWHSITGSQRDYWIGLVIRMLLLISPQKKQLWGL